MATQMKIGVYIWWPYSTV